MNRLFRETMILIWSVVYTWENIGGISSCECSRARAKAIAINRQRFGILRAISDTAVLRSGSHVVIINAWKARLSGIYVYTAAICSAPRVEMARNRTGTPLYPRAISRRFHSARALLYPFLRFATIISLQIARARASVISSRQHLLRTITWEHSSRARSRCYEVQGREERTIRVALRLARRRSRKRSSKRRRPLPRRGVESADSTMGLQCRYIAANVN